MKEKPATGKIAGFIDGSEVQAGKGQTIEFFHIPTGMSVAFKAWITDYSDNFESSWNSEDVYGRMDPIQTFQGTKRTIDIGWQVVAGSEQEAIDNMERCSMLFQMLYPTFEGSAMKSPPLLKLRMLNLIQDVSASADASTNAKDSGLVGTVGGFNYQPELDHGVFESGSAIYPKTINLSCSFTVLHKHSLGFDVTKNKEKEDSIELSQPGFPYNLKTKDAPESASKPAPKSEPKAVDDTVQKAQEVLLLS